LVSKISHRKNTIKGTIYISNSTMNHNMIFARFIAQEGMKL